MVYFNNKYFKTYDLDSINSIINRLAVDNNILSIFLYFPKKYPTIEDISNNENIEYENLITEFENNPDFVSFYKNIKDKTELSLNKIVYYYILLNKQFDKIQKNEDANPEFKGVFITPILEMIINEIKKISPELSIDINQYWNNRYSNIINYNKVLQNDKNNLIKQENVFNNFDKKIGIEYTSFELEKIKFSLELDVKNVSLLEIFNNIKLNSIIPFATTNYFYKILKDFTPFIEWSNLFDRSKTYFDKYKNIDRYNNIVIKLLQTDEKSNNILDYTEAILSSKDDNYYLNLEHNIKKADITRNELITRVLNVIDVENIKNEKDISVNGVFYFPNQKLNKYVLLDIIMNNPLFSSVLTVDETTITVKSNVFIYFNNPIVGNISAYLTEQTAKKILPIKDNEYKDLFPMNSKYIRVKVSKCESIEKVKYFQKILSKLFVIYNESYDSIIKFYRDNYINIEIGFEDNEEYFDEKLLKNIDPDIFKPNYTRKCLYEPTFINDEEAEEAEREGKEVMLFPKEKTKNSIPRKYICDHPKHKYPGLRNNPFENYEVFPYIPCCYKKSQVNKKGSRYRNYYFGEPLQNVDQKQQGIYISKIIIPNDNFGTLPKNINKIFSIVDRNAQYYRKGVYRNKNSFLNCVMEAMNEDTNILKLKGKNERENFLNKIRKDLATPDFAASCKQEMYDYTIEEIIDKIKNENEYLDPKLFIHLLEVKFNCNIFIFTRDNKGKLILPRHIKGYYKNKNKNKSVFIFEHTGAESEKVEYPQCELIVRDSDEIDQVDYSFHYDSNITKNIFNIFNKINTSYIFNKKIQFGDINFFAEGNIIPVTQMIDTYGKCRTINIVYKDEIDITIFTSPMQPLQLFQEKDLSNIFKVDIGNALKFSEELGILITKQIVDKNNYIKEIYGIVGNININIPIDGLSKSLPNIPVEIISEDKQLIYSDSYVSIIDTYNKYKKLSRYISEYMFWLFSKYLYNNNITNKLDAVDFIGFRNKYIILIEDFEYQNVPKTFSMNSGIMYENKLVIKSEETLKRLFFILQMMIIRNFNKLIKYHERKTIENYYIDITDFDTYTFQVILEGEDSIQKWIDEKNIDTNIYNKIVPDKKLPYFFRNSLIDNNIYIAQNTDSLIKAINISLYWNDYMYNPGNNPTIVEETILNFTLYSFKNTNQIKAYNVEGKETDNNIKIIGYKYGDISLFTVLLYKK